MHYQFQFDRYQHRFKHPLQTSYGVWEVREGIILKLTDDAGQTYWGEIAPVPWFGSETLEQAWEFCCHLPPEITEEPIFSIADTLPACQFGFESALYSIRAKSPFSNTLSYSRLLPAGKAALRTWKSFWEQGFRTFKWKIGVFAIAEELEVFHHLMQTLPPTAQVRLDANGGLSHEAANEWLRTCDEINTTQQVAAEVEYLEQPLPPQNFEQMQQLNPALSSADRPG
ncbi:o-succinylbenzoate synthase [Kovacikia minuta CCNUW1]|uniref:o-succinylbenzoate synthase n=1 Tax=Kovacikia minuta TaxID=2931930 RepID=UPI001CCFB303|nr:o-succinylbenzoate synthase [Kovacikia minuta CCNUW1]